MKNLRPILFISTNTYIYIHKYYLNHIIDSLVGLVGEVADQTTEKGISSNPDNNPFLGRAIQRRQYKKDPKQDKKKKKQNQKKKKTKEYVCGVCMFKRSTKKKQL